MITRLVLILNALICFAMSFHIIRIIKRKYALLWIRGVSEVIVVGLLISGVTTLIIGFMPEQEILKHATMAQLTYGTLVVSIWNVVFSLTFIKFLRKGLKIGARIAKIWTSKIGIQFISYYAVIALIVILIFPTGIYREGFALFLRDTEISTGTWYTALIEIPALLWTAGMGLILVWSFNNKNSVKKWIGCGLVFFITCFFIITTWTLGVRGLVLKTIAFFWIIFVTLRMRKLAWVIVGGALVFVLSYLGTTAIYRYQFAPYLSDKSPIERFKDIIALSKETPLKQEITENINNIIFRVSPAEPGIFVDWVKSNDAYAGFRPLIGAVLGFLPRSIWPEKTAAGSLTESVYDTPAYLTGRILGTPTVSRNTHPGTNAFWMGGYVAVLVFAFIASWFITIVIGIGVKNLRLGILVLSVVMAWGGAFLICSLDRIFLMFSQGFFPITILFLLVKLIKK